MSTMPENSNNSTDKSNITAPATPRDTPKIVEAHSAMWMSLLIFPGAGHFANRLIGRGTFFAMSCVALLFFCMYEIYTALGDIYNIFVSKQPLDDFGAFGVPTPLIWSTLSCLVLLFLFILAAADAYYCAQRLTRAQPAPVAPAQALELTGMDCQINVVSTVAENSDTQK